MPLTANDRPEPAFRRRTLFLLGLPLLLVVAALLIPAVRPVELSLGSFHLVAGLYPDPNYVDRSPFFAYRTPDRSGYASSRTRVYTRHTPLAGCGVHLFDHNYSIYWFSGTDVGPVNPHPLFQHVPVLVPPPKPGWAFGWLGRR